MHVLPNSFSLVYFPRFSRAFSPGGSGATSRLVGRLLLTVLAVGVLFSAILLAAGAVKEEAVVENGKIVVGKIMRVHATFDHRFIDGFHASVMSRVMRKWMENPFEHFDPLPRQDASLATEKSE